MYINQWHLKQAIATLHQSGLIAYATEGLFGFGCLANDEQALTKLRQLKKRDQNKAFILIGDHISRFADYIDITAHQKLVIQQPTNQPTTWLVPFKPNVSPVITGKFQQLAIRITTHPQVIALTKQLQQPLISTSANWAGGKPCTTSLQTKLKFQPYIDYILPGRTLGYKSASHIIDIQTGQRIR
jgi:L-threonylcarbamoyladenylate synthase